MGTLTSGPVKDVYQKLVWYDTSTKKLMYTNASDVDAEVGDAKISGDLTVTGGKVTFGNSEVIHNESDNAIYLQGQNMVFDSNSNNHGASMIAAMAQASNDSKFALYDGTNIRWSMGQDQNDSAKLKFDWQNSTVGGATKFTFTSGGNLTATTFVAGNVSLNTGGVSTTGDLEINADGGQITIKDDTASHFLFDCDNTALTIYDDQDEGDLFKIQIAQHGATTISTIDDDATAGHLTLDPDGKIICKSANTIELGHLDAATDAVQCLVEASADTFQKYASFQAEAGDHSQLRLYEAGGDSANDYVELKCLEHGATSLTTVDAAATAANLTMTIDGNITLDSADEIALDQTNRMKWKKAGTTYGQMDVNTTSNFTLYEQGGASTDDYFQIECGTDGDTTIKTVDTAGAGGHLRFAPDGSFLIKATSGAGTDAAGWGQLWIKTGLPTDLYYTNDAGQDIQLTSGSTPALPVKFTHLINGGFNYSSAAGTKVYVPLNGSLSELSYTGTTEYSSFLAPFDGSLKQVVFRSEEVCGSTVVGLHKSSAGTEFPNTTAAQTVTVDMTTDDTPYKFEFTSSNVFSAGDVIAISFDPTNDANDTVFTVEFMLNSSSGL